MLKNYNIPFLWYSVYSSVWLILCNQMEKLSLAKLKQGQFAIIKSFTNEALSSKLIEMGCVPGEAVQLSKTAPLGSPIAIHIAGCELSLRKDEAASVIIELVA